mmetsp:Transcript_7178/g.20058  ORF Transcript_7178/g.20058 Transcript_7178/m.20058 type:complete len:232 (-) Transcript_7178:1567-2262(-)
MMADGATDQGAAVGDHAAAAAEPETASDLIPRRVSHKLKEQHDWNVMRGQPPVTALQVLVLLPLVLARATLAVVGLLCVALFWQLAVLEARCARMCCRARSGCKALNTCSFWVLGKLFLFCFGLWTRVEVVGGPPARGPVAALVRGAPFPVAALVGGALDEDVEALGQLDLLVAPLRDVVYVHLAQADVLLQLLHGLPDRRQLVVHRPHRRLAGGRRRRSRAPASRPGAAL